jgi:hypothetical protein
MHGGFAGPEGGRPRDPLPRTVIPAKVGPAWAAAEVRFRIADDGVRQEAEISPRFHVRNQLFLCAGYRIIRTAFEGMNPLRNHHVQVL